MANLTVRTVRISENWKWYTKKYNLDRIDGEIIPETMMDLLWVELFNNWDLRLVFCVEEGSNIIHLNFADAGDTYDIQFQHFDLDDPESFMDVDEIYINNQFVNPLIDESIDIIVFLLYQCFLQITKDSFKLVWARPNKALVLAKFLIVE
jgi:hypothetical protein